MHGCAQLHCHSYFSLLDGVCSPEDLIVQAQSLGIQSLALTDHDSLAGAVRFWVAARRMGIQPIFGAEVTLADSTHLTLLAQTQTGYSNLCRLITASRMDQVGESLAFSEDDKWIGKVIPAVTWEHLQRYSSGLIALSGCRRGVVASVLLQGEDQKAKEALSRLQDVFGDGNLFIELQHHNLPDDDWLISSLLEIANQTKLPVVATHNIHYAVRDQGKIRDALIAVRHNMTLSQARQEGFLPLNKNYSMPSFLQMSRKFLSCPEAITNSNLIADRCQVSLDFLAYRLPRFELGEYLSHDRQVSPFERLYELCHDNLPLRYPDLRPITLKQLAYELEIIDQAELAEYFLVVWDIVRFAKQNGIRCQGRGSAAGSLVAYLLGISNIDPLKHNLLFDRFLSSDRYTMPDIDVDFAANRREEVIQYVYHRYGRSHAAMVCNYVTYQARLALRDFSKVLNLSGETVSRIERRLDTNSPKSAADRIEEWFQADSSGENFSSTSRSVWQHLVFLLRGIDGCPRHLSIHSGGMIITRVPLDLIVPLEPATMPGRVIVQWDKNSVEDAGLIKIDLLALRTLGVISEAVEHISSITGKTPNLDALPLDDPAIFQMLGKADTIGAFQVESRAQQQMLPRLKPTCFEDIVVEVAIVRPGPIQGGAIHPYLRRRGGLEPLSYLHPNLEPVLKESLGVLLFQEQAIRIAIVTAGFTPGEADGLRRVLSRDLSEKEMGGIRNRFIQGAMERGVDENVAGAIFSQMAAFAGYGFCKSHSASFALVAYQTMWLKHYYPIAFYCAILNHQPMGFYSPEVIVGDARRHGVMILAPDVNHSHWEFSIEQLKNQRWALRTGLHTITQMGKTAWNSIKTARDNGRFVELDDFCRRTRLPVDVITGLIRSGACDSFGDRRQLIWRLGELDYRPDEFDLTTQKTAVELPALEPLEQTIWEYEVMGLASARQLMVHYRQYLRYKGIFSTWQVKAAQAGQRVKVAGMVVVRQRPATAKGILFASIEDESGLLDLVVKPETYQRFREVIRHHTMLVVEGIVQKNDQAVSVLAWKIEKLETDTNEV